MGETWALAAPDGVTIYGRTWVPETRGEPRLCVQLAHGMAEHIGRYDDFARYLAARGCAVYGHDHRGHGQTGEAMGILGHFGDRDGFQRVIDDMAQVTSRIEAEHPGVPIVLLGHSMGSWLSLAYMEQHGRRLAGAVLSGAGFVGQMELAAGLYLAKREAARVGARSPSERLYQMTFGNFNKPFAPNRTPLDWLSRDDAVVDAYMADPKCGQMHTCGFFIDYFSGVKELQRPENLRRIPSDLPVLIVAGSRDPVGKMGKGVERLAKALAAAGVRDVTVKLYPGARHEVLNETNRAEVYQDVWRFMETVLRRA
ncbi:alpha/beta hydrolase [Alicyclobacillus vulcanalis]|uniref:Lysophospholipase, alpha-beta hydrolase superfamily n=1 Tax=Alicyclobacillus vulcanalis TaxID=252246 RepID=A0A1N7JQH2_9BACL|nr:alpha/beta hydrolase [Alicyclobacillus vulcanalis]SIS51565.1 Lysophospholipase, alpha-beta hydrolase superfamily [Alicyclobacillus vulcanalis]